MTGTGKPELEVLQGFLAALLGPATLEPLAGGYHSRTYLYRLPQPAVAKLYRPEHSGLLYHRLEAEHMATAGLGERVLLHRDGSQNPTGRDLLVTRYFPGRPLGEEPLTDVAFSHLLGFLQRMHQRHGGLVNIEAVRRNLERHYAVVALDPEALAVWQQVQARFGNHLATTSSFLHNDTWGDNVLVNQTESMLVDWLKAGYGDPAQELALLKTGGLDRTSDPERHFERILAAYGRDVARRLSFYLPYTYLRDVVWLKNRQPHNLAELQRKLQWAWAALHRSY
ncbi:MAG: aminoglycoside phosphotransferase family protein [Deinococcus sp.]|nr:aminoglycoside phosphotransferase family protein [Deinococcus sp.]